MQGNLLTAEYLKIRSRIKGEKLLKATIEWHCAPVIYGFKPSVLINLGKPNTGLLACLWEQYKNNIICDYHKFQVHFHLFHGCNRSIQLFCFVPERINRILCCDDARYFLSDEGYSSPDLESIITFLKEKFRFDCPHEIGIFLGYPVEDVRQFIKNNGKNYLLNGYWKVYSDIQYATYQFDLLIKQRRICL